MILSDSDKKQITEAVSEAEKKTSAEIVPVIVPRSGSYSYARWRFAVVFALLLSAGMSLCVRTLPALWALALDAGALLAGLEFARVPFILRRVVSRRHLSARVHQRAVVAFQSHGLTATRDRTGVLILISLFERRVEILADTGISQKLPNDYWQELVNGLIGEIRQNRLAAGLSDTIRKCGARLEEQFPRRADDVNELPDLPSVEE